ncbi:FHA domain-containing protein [Arthrobacter sp. Helios]|uniref:FHA domain-containing protein n=1 Tax=Arthrobacter sp. Helios TaxID=2828862 RepID=UPI00204BC9F0|nr:FHA domain-containing protein [Arthrobacter sp. Helios]UPO78754.1 FHA domain-containing protein [Arthrobacter sp. Helios]
MEGLRYRPGAWIALARNSRLVLLPPGSGQARVNEVWDVLSGDASLDAVFEAITGGLAGSLSHLPPFGLVSVDDRMHVLLRGPLELAISEDNSSISGAHLRTWSEQVLPADGHAVLTVTDARDDAVESPLLLTLCEGMATVSQLELDLGAARSSRPSASAAVPASTPGASRTTVPPTTVPPSAAAAPTADVPPVPSPATSSVPPLPPAAPATAVPPVPPAVPAAAAAAPRVAEVPVRTRQPDQSGAESVTPDLSDAVPWLKLTPPPVSSADVPRPVSEAAADEGEPTETLPPVTEDHDGDTIMGFNPQPGTPLPGTPQPGAPVEGTQGQRDAEANGGEDTSTIRSDRAGSPGPGAGAPGTGAPGAADPGAAPAGTGPTVLARECPHGHVSPPTAGSCRTCGAELSGEPRPVPRPSLGTMRLSTGPVYELDRNAIIGRQPSAARVQGAALPRMVQVPSESGDISRSHAEIRLEGWHVMLRDLFSTNGTVLIREGQLPRRLAQGEAAILLDGDIAELGDNVSIRFEGLA